MLMRKLLGSRNVENRVLSIHGFSILLLNYVPSDNLQLEIISALKPAFSYPLDVREHLYQSILSLLIKFSHQKEISHKNKVCYYFIFIYFL